MGFKVLTHKIFRRIGYDFKRYIPDNFFDLKRLKIIEGENVNLVLDVGASEGHYVKALRDTGYKGRVLSIEPLSQSFKILNQKTAKDLKWKCINAAVGAYNGETEIYVSMHETSSSLLPINEAHLTAMPSSKVAGKEKVKIRTLDSLSGIDIETIERIYLKIDVQGYEMFVLNGAAQILSQTRAIELELSLVPLYEGAPVFSEMVNYLEMHGFLLSALNHVFSDPNTDRLLQVDGIFKRVK